MKPWRFVVAVLLTLLVFGGWLTWDYYMRLFAPKVNLEESSVEFFVNSDWKFTDLNRALFDQGIIEDTSSFAWVARFKKYDVNLRPGRYIILDGMNNNQLVNLLRSENKPFNVIVRSVREKDELIAQVSHQLEFDSASLSELLENEGYCQRYGFVPSTVFSLFIPNTYEFYWNTTVEEFVERMAREYKRFWTDERKAKASSLGLSQTEVAILASIVQSEQAAHSNERPVIAGLYLNRLRKGMKLDSDPTLIKALGDYSIKRVLKIHKEIDSPFNTYMYAGLPPEPILLPETSSIDAVLNAETHNYLFMCAKEDFSGYHNFTSSYREHINNARRYQRALNERKIYR